MPTVAVADPANVQLSGKIGCPVKIPLQFWLTQPGPTGSGGVPQDISGWVFMLTIKRFVTDSDAAAVYSKDWLMAAGSTGGATSQELPASVTQNQRPGALVFDVKTITLTSPEPQFVMGGTITLELTPTQRITPNLT
jgi:hypothetical protein